MSNIEKQVQELVTQGYGRVVIARQLGLSKKITEKLIKKAKEALFGVDKESLKESIVEGLEGLKTANKKALNTKPYPKTGSILIVGDSHSKVGESNERFTWLGKVIAHYKPDVVVQIGDFFDMPSLSSYDVGKKSFEGRRLIKDLEAGYDALERINQEINKVRGYSPIKISITGNHEARLSKAINADPKLEGTLSMDNYRFQDYGWEVYDFLKPCTVMGIDFQHYYVAGSMDRSISSENTGRAIAKKYHKSALAGHNHKLDLAWESSGRGNLMMTGTVGCYFEHEEEWQSLQAQSHFWRGLILLEDVENGEPGYVHQISMKYIKKHFK